jgi:hypothetical protein
MLSCRASAAATAAAAMTSQALPVASCVEDGATVSLRALQWPQPPGVSSLLPSRHSGFTAAPVSTWLNELAPSAPASLGKQGLSN